MFFTLIYTSSSNEILNLEKKFNEKLTKHAIPKESNRPIKYNRKKRDANELCLTSLLETKAINKYFDSSYAAELLECLNQVSSVLDLLFSAAEIEKLNNVLELTSRGGIKDEDIFWLTKILTKISENEEDLIQRNKDRKLIITPQKINCSGIINQAFIKTVRSAYNITKYDDLKDLTQRPDLRPLLLKCIRENPVDPLLHPRLLGDKETKLNINYRYGIQNLVTLENDGKLVVIAIFHFSWLDNRREWEDDLLPRKVLIYPNEIWHPILFVENCLSTEDACFIKPTNNTLISLYIYGYAEYYLTKVIEI